MDRWGAKHMITAMFTGFKALPEKGGGVDPRTVLGIASDARLAEDLITSQFRILSKKFHPDIPGTGDAEKWRELREAHDLLMQNVRGK